ncbi:MAG: stage II sporulation protein M [Bacteroidota bacterium]
MREVTFVRQNAEAWQALEGTLADRATPPDALANAYVRLLDDLAYSRTFYPRSPTTRYLNDLAGQAHTRLHRSRRESRGRLGRFWSEELPRVVYAERIPLLASAALFLLMVAIGVLSTMSDPTFVRLILGDFYVNMTLANIEAGDPMAVYKKAHQVDMTFGITINNIRVSFLAFAGGIAAGLGTAYILVVNGIMVGAFQGFFYQQNAFYEGVFLESVLTIWIHGTLEISAIILAGGAGFVMARGMLAPGTYPRGVAFLHSARQGLKLVVGLVPIFAVAGLLESFVTRLTEMPSALSMLIIAASAAFLLWYFVAVPRRRHHEDMARAAAPQASAQQATDAQATDAPALSAQPPLLTAPTAS